MIGTVFHALHEKNNLIRSIIAGHEYFDEAVSKGNAGKTQIAMIGMVFHTKQ